MTVQSAVPIRAAEPFSLAGRLAMVTGARRGIGLAISEARPPYLKIIRRPRSYLSSPHEPSFRHAC